MNFSIPQGVLNLLSSRDSKASDDYSFCLSGDINQMSIQKEFLKNQRFNVAQSNVYPVLKEEDVPAALKAIFEYKVQGWWHYKEKYVELKICSSEEFDTELEILCKREFN
jgi:hypothetical protein